MPQNIVLTLFLFHSKSFYAIVCILQIHHEFFKKFYANFLAKIRSGAKTARFIKICLKRTAFSEEKNMNRTKIYAHSANKENKRQPLDRHCTNVALKASEFAKSFDSEAWAYNIGLLHDLGKASTAFQNYLKSASNEDSDEDGAYISKTNHSGAGAVCAVNEYKEMGDIGKILAYCIAGHHAGLADYNGGPSSLSFRVCNNGGNDKKYIDEKVEEFKKEVLPQLKKLTPPPLKKCDTELHLWIRMLYSCLVDADFIDTETHINCGEKDRGKFNSIKELSEKFFGYMKKFENPKNDLNKLRNDIFEQCRLAGKSKEGFFELTVPTGGGKTLSSMAFAFTQALQFKKSRIIYVIPYTSIIEQTTKTLKDILSEENIIEHHSSIDTEKETEKSRLACENWDAPVIITTNVQFFESLYANKSSRCRKLHNIANSIIILDEAQMISPEFLYPIEDIMRQLADNYKCTFLFSTATQPYFENIKNLEKIIPDSMNLYKKLKRVHYHFPDKQETWDALAKKISCHNQVLCVVNTRKDCYDLYQSMKLKKQEDTMHLSALICAEHRSKKIAEIKEKLKNGNNIRLISTQLIEAGVDIDFPVAYRAFAGLSSIIQTAGRCNREGKLDKGDVFVFNPPTTIPAGIMLKAANAFKNIISLEDFDENSMDSSEISKLFFKNFIASVNSTGKDEWYNDLVKDAYNQVCQFNLQFKTYAQKFKLIDDWSKPIIIRYGDNEALIEELRYAGISRDLMRRLQRYIVNVSPKALEELHSKGLVEAIHKDIYVQEKNDLYDEEVGLNIFTKDYGIEIGIV